nr:prepilin-type N-terminal cleavage/methylation domain-containing protein [Deinococcus sp. JMULE3]
METAVRGTQGFSLLEVLFVVTILGILLALGVPSYQRWITRTELDRAAGLVATEIQTTRSAARKGTVQTFTATAGGTSVVSRGTTLNLPTAKTDGAVSLTFQPPFGTIQTPAGAVAPITPVNVIVRSTRDPNLFRTVSVVSLMGKVIVK